MATKSQPPSARPPQPQQSAPAPAPAPARDAGRALAASVNIDPKKLRETTEKIAYELYEKRGRAPGRHEADWLEAEKIARERLAGGNV